ncbi:MAG TPA: bifunctional tetrahydrofolate synthase/dihydrofolate synthase, partial [Steroidobacteraceae bacterium]
TLEEWLTQQESVHPKTIDMGLARVSAVARALGVDKPDCQVITVGGTNGKGSTVVHLDGFLRAGGASAGMFTSPHFVRYNERIRVNGVDVDDDEIVAAFERIERARGATTLTFFEFNALAALIIFADRKVDVAVLEVGLGGRLDAVNLVDADVAVVCSVGFDHRDYLGDTLDLIGAEKAGIFRAFQPAVLGTDDMPASVYGAIASLKAQPVVAGRDFKWQLETAREGSGGARWDYTGLRMSLHDLPPSALAGSIQYRNASTALAAIESLQAVSVAAGKRSLPRLELNERTVSEALRSVRLAGRFQVVHPPGSAEWILDIAHNEPAAAIFAGHIRERPMPLPGSGSGRTYAVVGILGDKDAKSIARYLEPLVDHWIVCALPGPRGTSAEQLAQRLQLPAAKVTLASSVEGGCEVARREAREGDRVLVFGSFHTVGPVLRWLGIY